MSQYDWKSDSLPQLKHHSRCKHEILHDYLLRYICVLHRGTLRYGNEKFNLTIVDGCAGGGKFLYGEQVVGGSPFVILNAIQEAKAAIQTKRRQSGHADIDINIDVILVEKNKQTAKFLQEQIRNQSFAKKPLVMQGDFNEKLPQIINFIKAKSRGKKGRCLFFLDQYGYSQIGLSQVRKILRSLKSEVILTFAVDYLIDYLSKSKVKTLEGLELSPQQIGEMLDLAENTKEHRYAIEHILAQHLKSATGAKFYTPFFIRGDDTHRGYWLVHLSSHYRARDEMMNVHWEKSNQLQHFGLAGIDMLGYRTDNDELYTKQLSLGKQFRFDHDAEERVKHALRQEIPELIYQKCKITYRDFMNGIFNHTPANRNIINEVLWEGVERKEFFIPRREAKNIKDNDIIKSSSQRVVNFSKRNR